MHLLHHYPLRLDPNHNLLKQPSELWLDATTCQLEPTGIRLFLVRFQRLVCLLGKSQQE